MADPRLLRLHYLMNGRWDSFGYDNPWKALADFSTMRSDQVLVRRAVLVRQRHNRNEILMEFTR